MTLDAPLSEVRYAEDAVGLTWRVWVLVALPVLLQVVVMAVTPITVWGATLGGFGAIEICAVTFAAGCGVRGIRMTDQAVRIGGCRRAERLRRRGRLPDSGRVSPRSKFRREFVVPFDAIRTAVVVERPEFASLPRDIEVPGARGRSRHRRGVADLRTPLANAVLMMAVDLSRAQVPPLSGFLVDQLVPVNTSSRYLLTDNWVIATRRPDELRAALDAAGLGSADQLSASGTSAPEYRGHRT